MLVYVLELRDRLDRPGHTLIKLVFGKNAADLFGSQGINDAYRAQRQRTLNLLGGRAETAISSSKRPNLDMQIENVYESNYHSKGSGRRPEMTASCKRESPARTVKFSDPEPVLDSEGRRDHVETTRMRMGRCGVPVKYIEHWSWLTRNCEAVGPELARFDNLLNQVYCFRE